MMWEGYIEGFAYVEAETKEEARKAMVELIRKNPEPYLSSIWPVSEEKK